MRIKLESIIVGSPSLCLASKKDGKLYLEVDAVNSYDVPIHIIYDGSSLTDIPNILMPENNQSSKYIRKAQLIIRKDGVEYNAQGIKL